MEEEEGKRVKGHRRPTTTDDAAPPRHCVAKDQATHLLPPRGAKTRLPPSGFVGALSPIRPLNRAR